ncbi:Pyridoxamine 5'-phosphate oxidase family protein [Rhodovastum atsumiense]|uniref:Pyridoxamine 5'-phosphate oxidase family protein n=1 Tax=Rhodovastum atsumiense TaxID=504468 RepID=A0A5M6IKN2_9PROT|nr:pyridoxamine 5'-phosphate oxidase family protein [Rhodovastum atsumiense]KAA5608823.1 pyridoxamine 5'-phosphate oxidase family protein [Rhodovastum atsumiense]CAH2600827.1 Pyridoxamine 5'-phosphate oxidase family protein [Rhodovastum atsumiense]
MQPTPPSDFARLRRKPQRGAYDQATIHAILDAAPFCHVGHVIQGRPVVIPTFHWRHGDTVFWHGSSASRMIRANAAGGEVCLTVSLLDAWVLARTSFNHSANYRSVMCFGVPSLVDDPTEKLAAMRGFVERLFPGRWETLRPPTEQEVKATAILSLPLTEASAKLRSGPPGDDPEDRDWPVWAGTLPLRLVGDAPVPDDDVQPGQEPPATPFAG